MNDRGNEAAFFQVLCHISDLRRHIFSFINGIKYDNIISGDWIARNGYFSLMLEKHRNNEPLIFTTNAMDYAAAAGNLEMLKWIHYNIGSGCTEQALYAACGGNRLDIIEFLNDNHLLQGCTGCAAMATKKLTIIQYLHAIRSTTKNGCCCHNSKCCSLIFYSALADENIAILNWLYDVGVTNICDCFDEKDYYVNKDNIGNYLEDMCRNNRRLSLNWLLNRMNYIYHDLDWGWLAKKLSRYSFLSGNGYFIARLKESEMLLYEQRDMENAIIHGHDQLVRNLYCHGYFGRNILVKIIKQTMKCGNLDMLRFIVAEIGTNRLAKLGAGNLVKYAIDGKNRELLEYIINLLYKLNMIIPPISSISAYKLFYDVDMLDELYHTPGIVLQFNDFDMERAICRGQIHLVKWLIDNTHLTIPDDAMDMAAGHGFLDLFKWLFENTPFNLSHTGIMEAEYQCIKWFLENIEELPSEVTLDADAVEKWDLDFVRLLHRKNIVIREKYIKQLAKCGKLDILQWIYYNTNYDFHQASRYAIIGNQLDVLKWLRQINQLEVNDRLLSLAFYCRNLAAIIWLHNNMTDSDVPSDAEIYEIVAYDDLCLIQLLFNRGILSKIHIDTVVMSAASRDAVEVLQWMITEYGIDCLRSLNRINCCSLRAMQILNLPNLSVHLRTYNLNTRELRLLNSKLGKLEIMRSYSENITDYLFKEQGILKFLERNIYLAISMFILLPIYSILDVFIETSPMLLFIRRINYLVYLICLLAKFIDSEIVAR